MAKNKILFKHFLPQIALFGVLFTFVGGSGVYSSIKKGTVVRGQDLAIASLLTCIAALLCCTFLYSYKDGEKFASVVARKYIKQETEKHPELKDFENILSNQRAMKNVATMISNSLHKEEQKRILDIVATLERTNFNSAEEEINITRLAIEEITQILSDHAATHPEFITEIYAQMAYADMNYVVPAQLNSRTR